MSSLTEPTASSNPAGISGGRDIDLVWLGPVNRLCDVEVLVGGVDVGSGEALVDVLDGEYLRAAAGVNLPSVRGGDVDCECVCASVAASVELVGAGVVITVSEWSSPQPMMMLPRSVLASVTITPLVKAETAAAMRPSSPPQAVSALMPPTARATAAAVRRGRLWDRVIGSWFLSVIGGPTASAPGAGLLEDVDEPAAIGLLGSDGLGAAVHRLSGLHQGEVDQVDPAG